MARNKSAMKRYRQSELRNARNTHYKSTMRTFIKRVRAAVATGDKNAAAEALKVAVRTIDSTWSKNVIHHKTASRYVSRLTRAVQSMG